MHRGSVVARESQEKRFVGTERLTPRPEGLCLRPSARMRP